MEPCRERELALDVLAGELRCAAPPLRTLPDTRVAGNPTLPGVASPRCTRRPARVDRHGGNLPDALGSHLYRRCLSSSFSALLLPRRERAARAIDATPTGPRSEETRRGDTHRRKEHRRAHVLGPRSCRTRRRGIVEPPRERSRRALLVRLLRGSARRHAAAARSPLAGDADVRQGGGVQRRVAWVHGSPAGDLRRAARTPGDRRPVAPRQRGRAGRVGIQRQPSVEPVVDLGEPIQRAVAALGPARPAGRFRRCGRRTLRHAAQRRPQSLPLAGRGPESHRRRLRAAADGAHADPRRGRHVERQHRRHLLDLPQRPGRHRRGRPRARGVERQQRARRREPAAQRVRRREQRLHRHQPEPRARERQHHQLPAVRAC